MKLTDLLIEKPRLGVPASLIVDDPAPCINPFYYYRLQVDREGHQRHEPCIPLDFLEQFAQVCRVHGLRGKFSVLPFPAGLGSIVDGWPGCERAELQAWLALVRSSIAPDFDITPEIMTHTLALDLDSGTLLPQSEHEWLSERTPGALKQYFDAALGILRQAGFAPTGITQPVAYSGSRDVYARATLAAIRDSGGPAVTFFFLDGNFEPPPLPEPRVVLLDRARGEAVVDIVANCNDYFWPTQRVTRKPAEQVADEVLSADGSAGRLAELADAGAWLLWVCHWQTLYSDGSREGLRALDQVAARLAHSHGDRLLWLTLSEVARYRAASEACTIETQHDAGGCLLGFDAVFDCPDWTTSIAWHAVAPQTVSLVYDGEPQRDLVADRREDALLAPFSWRFFENRLFVCFDLRSGGQTVHIRAEARAEGAELASAPTRNNGMIP